jgi:hypothetical protein
METVETSWSRTAGADVHNEWPRFPVPGSIASVHSARRYGPETCTIVIHDDAL